MAILEVPFVMTGLSGKKRVFVKLRQKECQPGSAIAKKEKKWGSVYQPLLEYWPHQRVCRFYLHCQGESLSFINNMMIAF